jgi:putative ATP-binding cassette transporter
MERTKLFPRFWPCATGFWCEPSSRVIWGLATLLAVGVLLELFLAYRLNIWTRDFFDALERKDGPTIWQQALLFVPLAAAAVALATLLVWGRMSAQRKWRAWLTAHLIEYWLANDRYRRLDRIADAPQNPEYRIAEDARVATEAPVDFAVGLARSLLTAIIFIGVLWNVGGGIVVGGTGQTITLPGYLVIGAVLYALCTTAGMLVIGRRLVQVIEDKNHAEAEFRRAASRLREKALLHGDAERRDALRASVGPVIARWRYLCGQLMRTTVISQGNLLVAPVVALVLCAPKYLAGTMSLGEVTQAAAAFFAVQAAFNWLVDNYPRLADWTSAVNRVAALLVALDGLSRVDSPRLADRPAPGQHNTAPSAAD